MIHYLVKYQLSTGPICPSSHDVPFGCPSPLSKFSTCHHTQTDITRYRLPPPSHSTCVTLIPPLYHLCSACTTLVPPLHNIIPPLHNTVPPLHHTHTPLVLCSCH